MATRFMKHSEGGFTLIEVLAALAVFSIAAVGILRLTTENAAAVQRIETRALARMVADNLLVETLVDRTPTRKGARVGVEELGGRKWRWTQLVAETSNPLIVQVKITVSEVVGDARGVAEEGRVDAEVSAYDAAR